MDHGGLRVRSWLRAVSAGSHAPMTGARAGPRPFRWVGGRAAGAGSHEEGLLDTAAFEADLHRLGDRAAPVRALLVALAWGRAPGLPGDGLWVDVASALAMAAGSGDSNGRVTSNDVRLVAGAARHWVAETTQPGGSRAYRLRHDALASYLRGEPVAQTEATITSALLATVPASTVPASTVPASTVPASEGQRDWASAHPYLRAHLAQHAAAAGQEVLAALITDEGFLAVADPVTLSPLLSAAVPEMRKTVLAYRHARPLLGEDARANAAYLQEAAQAMVGTTEGAAARAAGEGAAPVGAVHPLYRTHLASLRRDDSLLALSGHAGDVNVLAFSPATTAGLLLASAGDDCTVRIWDPFTGMPAGEPLTGHTDWVDGLAFAEGPEGLLLASSGRDRSVRIWDPVTGTPRTVISSDHGDTVWSLAFGTTPGGRLLLATASRDHTVRLWDPLTGAKAGEPIEGRSGRLYSVAFGTARDGRLLLATGGEDHTVRIWDPLTGEPAGEPLRGHTARVYSVAFGTSPDGRLLLASGAGDQTVRVWDPLTGTPVGRPLTGHTGWAYAVAFGSGADGLLLLASGGDDQTVRIWDPLAGVAVGEPLTGHSGWISGLAFGSGPAGRLLLASSSGDQTARIWDPLAVFRVSGPRAGHTRWVTSVALAQGAGGEPLLAYSGGDRTVRVQDPVSEAGGGMSLVGHTSMVHSVAFGTVTGDSGGGGGRRLLASGGDDRTVRIWDLATGAPVGKPLVGRAGRVLSVAFGTGPKGLVLATAGDDQVVRLWDPLAGTQVGQPLTGHGGGVMSVAFAASPRGGLLLASASEDRTIRVWDPLAATLVCPPLTGHDSGVTSVAFGQRPDGRLLLVSGGDDHTVRLWDPLAGTAEGEPLAGHVGWVTSVAFGFVKGDGEEGGGQMLVLSGGGDKTVRIWDLATGTLTMTLRRTAIVRSLAVAGLTLAVGDDEGVCVIELDDQALRPSHPGTSGAGITAAAGEGGTWRSRHRWAAGGAIWHRGPAA